MKSKWIGTYFLFLSSLIQFPFRLLSIAFLLYIVVLNSQTNKDACYIRNKRQFSLRGRCKSLKEFCLSLTLILLKIMLQYTQVLFTNKCGSVSVRSKYLYMRTEYNVNIHIITGCFPSNSTTASGHLDHMTRVIKHEYVLFTARF